MATGLYPLDEETLKALRRIPTSVPIAPGPSPVPEIPAGGAPLRPAPTPKFAGGSPADPSKFARAVTEHPTPMGHVTDLDATAPEIAGQPAGLEPIGGEPGAQPGMAPVPAIKHLGFKERQALPQTSAGAPAGSSAELENKLERIADQNANPLGSTENMPGAKGKFLHVLGKIGNIAGDIVAPDVMARIPGTEMNRTLKEEQLRTDLGQAQTRETAAKAQETAAARETEAERHNVEAEAERNRQLDILAHPPAKPQTAAGLAALAKQGYELGPTGELQAIPPERLSKEAHASMAFQQASTELKQAQAELAAAGNDPNSPKYKLALMNLQVKQQNARTAAAGLGLRTKEFALHTQQFLNKLDEQGNLKPSGQAQSRGSAAQAALDLYPSLDQLVRDNAAEMGPVMGRLHRGEISLGSVDPEIAELYTAMESFYALQPAVHGFKNAEFVKDFKTALGSLERDPESFLAGMHGLKPTLEKVAAEGKTYHKRIVEGGAPPAVTPESVNAAINAPGGGPVSPAKTNPPAAAEKPPEGRSWMWDEKGNRKSVKTGDVEAILKDPAHRGWSKTKPGG